MPLKICLPALEAEEWRIITGSDPKNTYVNYPLNCLILMLIIVVLVSFCRPWSYHNGGSWPTLVWQFTLFLHEDGQDEPCEEGNRIGREKTGHRLMAPSTTIQEVVSL